MARAAFQPPRLTLLGVLELVIGVGLFFAMVTELGLFGLFAALAGLLITITAYQAVKRWGYVPALLVTTPVVLIILTTGAALNLGGDGSRESNDAASCRRNLRVLSSALFSLYDSRPYPSPSQVDANGKP